MVGGGTYAGTSDAWLNQTSAYRDNNYGGATELRIRYDGGTSGGGFREDCTVLEFALPGLTFSTLSSATLELFYVDDGSMTSGNAMGIRPYRIRGDRPWFENVYDGTSNVGVNWRYRDANQTQVWTNLDGPWDDKLDDGNGTNKIKKAGGTPPGALEPQNWVPFDVRPTVNQWYGGQGNEGFVLFSSSFEGSGSTVWGLFASRNAASAATRPRLTLRFSGARIQWTGSSGNTWDTAAANWSVGGFLGRYDEGDYVTFPAGAANPAVNIAAGGASPAAVAVQCGSTAYTFSGGPIQGECGLAKTGTGILTLTSGNTFRGGTVIEGGAIRIRHGSALGGTGGGTTVTDGARLELDGGISVGVEALVLNGNGGGTGSFCSLTGNNRWAGPIALGGAATIGCDAGSLLLTGGIAAGGYPVTLDGAGSIRVQAAAVSGAGSTLVKAGMGSLTTEADLAHTGTTRVDAGRLVLAGQAGMASTPLIQLEVGSTLDVAPRAGGDWTLGSLQQLTGNGVVTGTLKVAGTLAPGHGIGELSTEAQEWLQGGVYVWEIADASGGLGEGFDSLRVNGDLRVSASGARPFTVAATSLRAGIPGPAANFDPDRAYLWRVVQITGQLMDFAPEKVLLDAALFANDSRGGTFTLESGSLAVRFRPNHAPTATDVDYTRPPDKAIRVNIDRLLANHTADPDGDARELFAYQTVSAMGVPIRREGNYLIYETALNEDDRFIYTVRDQRAGYRPQDTFRLATAMVRVNVRPSPLPVPYVADIRVEGGVPSLVFGGVPGFQYAVQRTVQLHGIEWITREVLEAPEDGFLRFSDDREPLPEAEAYYRLREE